MSGMLSVDHHADYAGWTEEHIVEARVNGTWSTRRKLSCLVACSLVAWALFLAPFFLLD